MVHSSIPPLCPVKSSQHPTTDDARLVGSVQVNENVNGCDQDFGEDQNNDDPLEQFALRPVSKAMSISSHRDLRVSP